MLLNKMETDTEGSFTLDAYLDNISHGKSVKGPYIKGIITCPKFTLPFTKWNTPALEEGAYHVLGHTDVYNNKKSFIIEQLTHLNGSKPEFAFTRYDKTDLYKLVNEFIGEFTPNQRKIYDILLTGNGIVSNLTDRFFVEFAGSFHHDSCRYGLIAHSYKTAMVMKYILNNPFYACHYFDEERKDIMLVGAFLHDLGKVIEYTDGQISETGKIISHRTIMAYRVAELKKDLCSVITPESFWVLLSIFEQHHGEYEEHPRTVEAFFVHWCDNFDAQLSSVTDDAIDVDDTRQVKYEGMKLRIPKMNI